MANPNGRLRVSGQLIESRDFSVKDGTVTVGGVIIWPLSNVGEEGSTDIAEEHITETRDEYAIRGLEERDAAAVVRTAQRVLGNGGSINVAPGYFQTIPKRRDVG